MSRIQSLQKLLATEPNPDVKRGYKHQIAALVKAAREKPASAARTARTIKKSALPWVNLGGDMPVIIGSDGEPRYKSIDDEDYGTPFFVGFDDHSTSGVIVYAGDEEQAEEDAAAAILEESPGYFTEFNEWLDKQGVEFSDDDYDSGKDTAYAEKQGQTVLYINGGMYLSSTGSPTVQRLKKPKMPAEFAASKSNAVAAVQKFIETWAPRADSAADDDWIDFGGVSKAADYFIRHFGSDSRDEFITEIDDAIKFHQEHADETTAKWDTEYQRDLGALKSTLQSLRFGTEKAARPAMAKRGAPVRKAGGPVPYSKLKPKAKDRARMSVRTDSDASYVDEEQITEDLKDYIQENHPWFEDVKVYWGIAYAQGDYAKLDSGYLDVDTFAKAKDIAPVDDPDESSYSTRIKIVDGQLDSDYQGEFSDAFWEAASDDLKELNVVSGGPLYRIAREDMDAFNEDDYLDEFIEGNDHVYQFNADGSPFRDNQPDDEEGDDYEAGARPKMRKGAYPGKVGDFIKVSDVPSEAKFINDTQDVDAVRESVGPDAQGYDSFFVVESNGDYAAVWGMYGIVPGDNKQVARVV